MKKQRYTLEIGFLVTVIVVSLVGFSSLVFGEPTKLTAYHALHIVTSLAWLCLMLWQLVCIRQQRFHLHRTIGTSIFAAGPLLVASLTLLSVHSAAKDAVLDRADQMVVVNVMPTLQIALLVFLAFVLRRYRAVHGSLLLSTGLMFLSIALFFTLVSYVPGYRSADAFSGPQFAKSAQMSALICALIGLFFFVKNWKTGWPWLLAPVFLFLNGYLQFLAAETGRTKMLTALVASIGRVPAFGLGFTIFLALLWLAWRVQLTARPPRGLNAEPMRR